MNKLPIEIVSYIYSFDSTYHDEYKKCVCQIKTKNNYKKVINSLDILNYGPMYKKPILIKNGINCYKVINMTNNNRI